MAYYEVTKTDYIENIAHFTTDNYYGLVVQRSGNTYGAGVVEMDGNYRVGEMIVFEVEAISPRDAVREACEYI